MGRGCGWLGCVAPVGALRAFGPVRARCPRSQDISHRAVPAKAKAEPERRLYQLDDEVDRSDVLAHADERSRASGGAPGVDGETFEVIEAQGVERWLGERAQELREKTDRADAVRWVWRAKAQGKQRPLGLPTVRDRVVQTAAVRVCGGDIRGRPARRAVRIPGKPQCTAGGA